MTTILTVILFVSSLVPGARAEETALEEVTKLSNLEFAYPFLSPDGDRMVYQSNATGQWELYVMDLSTEGVQRITDNDSQEMMPAWAPDGSRIAFVSDRDGDFEVFTMKPDGSDVVQVTHDDLRNLHPYWSPDGGRLVFSTGIPGETLRYDIRWVRADGSGLETVLGDGVVNSYATFSPDGSELLFDRWVGNDSENGEVFVMDLETRAMERLTENEGIYDGYPAWSADGRHVIWASNESGSFQLYSMDRNGRNRRQLTTDRGDHRRANVAADGRTMVYNREIEGSIWIDRVPLAAGAELEVAGDPEKVTDFIAAYPAWSPDGRQIVYQSDALGQWDLFVMEADGSKIRQLTKSTADDVQPAWSPDGERIAFASDRDGDMEIFTIDTIGRGLDRVTSNDQRDIHPYWSPDGERLIFNRGDDTGRLSIWTVAVDGTDEKPLVDESLTASYASYSPDGKSIAFVKWLDGGENGEIFVANADGSDQRRLTHKRVFDGYPVWSPDGRAVLFSSRNEGPDGDFDLVLVEVDSLETRRITRGPASDVRADWAGSSHRRIVFNRARESRVEIVVVDPETLMPNDLD